MTYFSIIFRVARSRSRNSWKLGMKLEKDKVYERDRLQQVVIPCSPIPRQPFLLEKQIIQGWRLGLILRDHLALGFGD